VEESDDPAEVCYSDFMLVARQGARRRPASDADSRARESLVAEILARVRELPRRALAGFPEPYVPADWRYGRDNKLAVAVYDLQRRHDRPPPPAPELRDSHTSAGHRALRGGVDAVVVGDLLAAEEFAFLTAPLSSLIQLDLASRHASLRDSGAPEAPPRAPPDPPHVDPLPDHPLWQHTRERLVQILRDLGEPDVYVVDLHLGYEWVEDVRAAGVEVRWSTERDLAARRAAWKPDAHLLKLDPLAAEQLPWETWNLRAAGILWSADADPEGHALLADYAREAGLWYTDAEHEEGSDEHIDRTIELSCGLRAGLPVVVRRLHESGEIAAILGHPVPVTFSSWEEHDPAWMWARAANPPELYERFGPAHERWWGPG
jgi:hypothetical protein